MNFLHLLANLDAYHACMLEDVEDDADERPDSRTHVVTFAADEQDWRHLSIESKNCFCFKQEVYMIEHFNDGCRRVSIVSNLSAEGPGFNPRSRERHTKDDKKCYQ